MSRRRADRVPPMRDGVGASRVGVGSAHPSVLHFLVARFPAVDDWPSRLSRGDVLDDAGRPLAADSACPSGLMLWYWRDPPPEPRVPFDIELLHHDEHLVVVDKPHFLPVIPSGRHLRETVLVRLRSMLGIETLAPMHRLDSETAGVLAFTVQPGARHAYQTLLHERRVTKIYEAVAPRRDDLDLSTPLTCLSRLEKRTGPGFMQMQVVDGEPNAETRIELIARLDERLAHYRLTPITGRTHQLRAQMNALGLPLLGDRIYPVHWPEPEPNAAPDYAQPLQLLARELSFVDPIDGRPRRFVSQRCLQNARVDAMPEIESDQGLN